MNVLAASKSADLTPLGVLLGFLGLCFLVRLVAGVLDTRRMENHFKERNMKLISKKWAPWDRRCIHGRLYKVVYRDSDGTLHRTYARTAVLEDVYLNDDKIIKPAAQPSIEEEKAALRRRLAELEAMDS